MIENRLNRAFSISANKLYGFLRLIFTDENAAVEMLEKTFAEVVQIENEFADDVLNKIVFTKASKLIFEKEKTERIFVDDALLTEINSFLNTCEVLSFNESLAGAQTFFAVSDSLNRLDNLQRAVIFLRLYCNKTTAEIAAIAEISENEIKKVLYDAYMEIMPALAAVCRNDVTLQGYPVLQILYCSVYMQSMNAFYPGTEASIKRILNLVAPQNENNGADYGFSPEDLAKPFNGSTDNSAVCSPVATADPVVASDVTEPLNYTAPSKSNAVWEQICSDFDYKCISAARDSLADAYGLLATDRYEARMAFTSIVEAFPQEAFGYLGLLMAEVGVTNAFEMNRISVDYREMASFNYAYRYGDISIKSFLDHIAGADAVPSNDKENDMSKNDMSKNVALQKDNTKALRIWCIVAAALNAVGVAAVMFLYWR